MFVRLILFLALFSGFNLNAQSKGYTKMLNKYYDGFPTITAQEAKKVIEKRNMWLLDIREYKEYKVSRIKGATLVGYTDFEVDDLWFIKKDQVIIVYCSIGARSQEIGRKLTDAGYTNVRNLYGGLFHWSNIGYPLVDDKRNVTEDIHGYSRKWGKWITKGNVVY
jgi:rhodanese-related sulfurtransferase